MSVHVGQVQTEVSGPGSTSGASGGSGGGTESRETRPGAAEDAWRRTEAEVARLRCRVAAEAFDD